MGTSAARRGLSVRGPDAANRRRQAILGGRCLSLRAALGEARGLVARFREAPPFAERRELAHQGHLMRVAAQRRDVNVGPAIAACDVLVARGWQVQQGTHGCGLEYPGP